MMQRLRQTDLAWSLIDAAKPQMTAGERNHVFISVGSGNSFTAIRILLKIISVKQIPVPARLVQMSSIWLDAYKLHEDHEHMRRLIEDIIVADAIRRSRPAVQSLPCSMQNAVVVVSPDGNQRRQDVAIRTG